MSVSSMTAIERRAISAVVSIFSLRMLGLFMILPVFSIYAKQLNDVTPLLIGVALGIYGLTQALLQIPFGFLSDRMGRKPIIILGLLLFAGGSGIAALSHSIYGVILGRSLQGASAIGCVMMALISDLTRESIRVWAMAVLGLSIGVSFMLAIVLGPILSHFAGVRSIFWVTGGLSLLAIGMLVAYVPDPERGAKGNEVIPQVKHLPSVLKDPALMPLNFGVFVLHAMLVILFLKLPDILAEVGILPEKTGQFYFWVFLSSLFSTALGLFGMEKRQKTRVGMAVSVLILALSIFSVLNLVKQWLGVAISLWAFFTAFNILEASLPSLVSKLAPKPWKGTALGIYSSLQFFGIFVGGLIGGWLDATYGMVGIVWFCTTLTMTWFWWILISNLRGVERWQEG